MFLSMAEFNERLKELRTEKGWLQKDLAEMLFVNSRTISNWENKTREPDIETIKKLAKIFDVTVGYLLGSED